MSLSTSGIFRSLKLSVGVPKDKTTFSSCWHDGFLKRHPDVAKRIAHSQDRKKAKDWTPEVCETYIQDLEEELNKNGWMDEKVSTEYVETELLPNMTAEKNVIFVDGHSSHILNVSFIKACLKSEKKIKVICCLFFSKRKIVNNII